MKQIKQTMTAENCKICNKQITGYSEKQVISRMAMHMRSHKEGAKK